MTPEQYIKNVLRSESPSFDIIDTRILHGVIGCCTEAGELLEAVRQSMFYEGYLDKVNLKEEVGDMLWYIGVILDACHLKFEVLTDKNTTLQVNPLQQTLNTVIYHSVIGCCIESGNMLDVIKKSLFYSRELYISDIKYKLISIMWNIRIILEINQWTLEEVMELNIAKLKKRYPEQFTSKHAIDRDLKAERKTLEEKKDICPKCFGLGKIYTSEDGTQLFTSEGVAPVYDIKVCDACNEEGSL